MIHLFIEKKTFQCVLIILLYENILSLQKDQGTCKHNLTIIPSKKYTII